MDARRRFDRKIVVEAAVPDAREIECAVLGNDEPEASVPGEVIPSREFYDYEAKYLDDGSQDRHPRGPAGDRSPRKCGGSPSRRSRRSTAPAWRASTSCCRGRPAQIYVNEVNTIPGFTTISMYSKMWAATGRRLSGTARSPDRARAGASRRKAAAPHQLDMSVATTVIRRARRRCGLRRVTAVVISILLAAAHLGAGDGQTNQSTGSCAVKTRSSAPMTSSSTRASIRWTPSCAAPAPAAHRRKPATCSRQPLSGGGSSSIPKAARSIAEFIAAVDRAIRTTEAWTDRTPLEAEAWFYLGGRLRRPRPVAGAARRKDGGRP